MYLKFIVAVFFLMVAGCKNSPVLKTGDISHKAKGKTGFLSADAKIRHTYIHNNTICAEPSPDVMNAIAQTISAQLSVLEQGDLGFQNSLVETVGEIGKRTPTIQLIRDALFRVCEGKANGAIDNEEYTALNRLYQQSMVSLVAIENLTKTSDPTSAVLSAKATMDGANSLHETWKKLGEENKLVVTAKNNLKEAEEKLNEFKKTHAEETHKITYEAACNDDYSVKDEPFKDLKVGDKPLSDDEVKKLKETVAKNCSSNLKPKVENVASLKSESDKVVAQRDATKEHYSTIAKTLGSTVESQVTIIHPNGDSCKDKEQANCQVRVRPSYSTELIKTVEKIVLATLKRGAEDKCLTLADSRIRAEINKGLAQGLLKVDDAKLNKEGYSDKERIIADLKAFHFPLKINPDDLGSAKAKETKNRVQEYEKSLDRAIAVYNAAFKQACTKT